MMHLNTRGQVSIMSQYSRCNYTDGVERDKRVVGGCEECLADTGVVHVVTGRRQDRRHLVYRTQPPTQLRHKHTEDLVSSVYTTVLLLFLIFNDFCQTKYLKIYRADLRQIFGAARTMAADVQAEISFFRSLKGRCHENQFYSSASVRRRLHGGEAERANVSPCI